MDTNKMREEFIRAYRRLLIAEGMKVQESRFEVRDGEFAHRETAIAWWAWQASREAVVVELPPRKSIDHYCYDQGANCNAEGHNRCLAQAAAAIEAQGLKVTP